MKVIEGFRRAWWVNGHQHARGRPNRVKARDVGRWLNRWYLAGVVGFTISGASLTYEHHSTWQTIGGAVELVLAAFIVGARYAATVSLEHVMDDIDQVFGPRGADGVRHAPPLEIEPTGEPMGKVEAATRARLLERLDQAAERYPHAIGLAGGILIPAAALLVAILGVVVAILAID